MEKAHMKHAEVSLGRCKAGSAAAAFLSLGV